MTKFSLDQRLLTSANFVRAGAVLADIGTDHAYLPIFLLKEDRISRAVLTDINKGPLASAEKNARDMGVIDKCTFVLCDGAKELACMGITDYTVCGMGGELIASIIKAAPHLCQNGVRLILQPMSRPAAVRECLCSVGFEILDERYSTSQGKYYLTILAEYTGKVKSLPCEILELGEEYPHPCDEKEYIEYMKMRKSALEKSIRGKAMGGTESEFDFRLLGLVTDRLAKVPGRIEK